MPTAFAGEPIGITLSIPTQHCCVTHSRPTSAADAAGPFQGTNGTSIYMSSQTYTCLYQPAGLSLLPSHPSAAMMRCPQMRSPDSTSRIAELGSDRSTATTLHLVWTLLAGNFCSMALGISAQHGYGKDVNKIAMKWQLGHEWGVQRCACG